MKNAELTNECIQFSKVRDVKSIQKAFPTDAGFDFFIPKDYHLTLEPNTDTLIPSGIRVLVPHGYCLWMYNKSGVATKKKLSLRAGIVDEEYRGEIFIHVRNEGTESIELVPDMKIAQGILVRVGNHSAMEISDEEYEHNRTERGSGGFGSTGN